MAKRKPKKTARLVSDARPTAANIDIPIFVPNDDGSTNIEIGKARLRYGTLVVELKDTAVSVAIQNSIARGVLLGLGFIMLQPDVVNEMYQDVVAKEEAEKASINKAKLQAIADSELVFKENEEGEPVLVPVDESKTVEEIVEAYRTSGDRDIPEEFLENYADEQHKTDEENN
jgi:hypothetical protein